MKTVLTIAGFDPSGGAGILADVKTISRFGCYGAAAVTSLTLQNTQGVFGAYHQTPDAVGRQLKAIFDDLEVDAIKIGMLPTPEVVEAVADSISANPPSYIVLDPVIRSTTGFELVDENALQAIIQRLFPLASVVTPNADEAGRISGLSVRDQPEMEQAARKMIALGASSVLVTGGDFEGDFATDLLVDHGLVAFKTRRVQSRQTHGTGCTFSSALACLLAQGYTLRESIPIAKEYLVEAIRTAPGLGRGRGPLNHFPEGSY
jgi:hydroxymethylpyrimidine kinase/phosphomethylpyrimidine kinase